MSKARFTPCRLQLAFALCVPFAAQPASIVINGTCEAGTCPLPTDSLSDGQSISNAFDFDYMFLNGDTYNIAGTYSASYSHTTGSTISVDPVVTYEGPSPSVAADVITFDLLQNYEDTIIGSWAGLYTESIPLIVDAAGGTAEGQLLYDNVGVGLVGPDGPGSYFVTQSANLDFGDLDTSDTLMADYNFVFNFAAGTTAGESVSSVTPEPVMFIPCGLGLILLTYGVRRRNRSRVEENR